MPMLSLMPMSICMHMQMSLCSTDNTQLTDKLSVVREIMYPVEHKVVPPVRCRAGVAGAANSRAGALLLRPDRRAVGAISTGGSIAEASRSKSSGEL